MAKSPNQKLKLVYLARILHEKTDEDHGMTMAEIISELAGFDISAERKSIYDDLEALRVAGFDVEKKTEGGRTVYYMASRTFELPELKLLTDAVQSSKFITRKKSEALIRKIAGLTSAHQAKRLVRNVYVANRIKTMNESVYYTVDDIQSAIMKDRQISFRYFRWNVRGEKELFHDGKIYKVSPWALMWDDENYYLVAFEHGDGAGTAEDRETGTIKHYRVDKMLNIQVMEERRRGEEHFRNFDMGLYSRKTFGMYSGEDEFVTLRCANEMAKPIVDRFGQDTVMRPVAGEDCFDVTVKVSVSHVFLTWIMNFGEGVRILAPEHVVRQQVELAERILKMYRD